MNVSPTYTIRLCKNGQEFKCIQNVVGDFHPRPTVGDERHEYKPQSA